MKTKHFVIAYDTCKEILDKYGHDAHIKLCGCWDGVSSIQVYEDKEHTNLLDTFTLDPSGYCDLDHIPENAIIESAHIIDGGKKKDVTRQVIKRHRAIHHKNLFQKEIYGVTRGQLILSFLGALIFLAFLWLFACGLNAVMK